jgi:hypothetical protein
MGYNRFKQKILPRPMDPNEMPPAALPLVSHLPKLDVVPANQTLYHYFCISANKLTSLVALSVDMDRFRLRSGSILAGQGAPGFEGSAPAEVIGSFLVATPLRRLSHCLTRLW